MKYLKIIPVTILAVAIALFTVGCKSIKSSYTPSAPQNSDNSPRRSNIYTDQVIYDKNDIRVSCLGYDTSGTLPEISFRIENNSDYDIYVTTDKLSINDYMVNRSLLCEVAKGKKALDGIVMFSSDLTDLGIYRIESIEFTLNISEADYYGKSPIDDSSLVKISY